MLFPTVIEITPRPAAVTPDTFIAGLTAPAPAGLDRADERTTTADRARFSYR